MKCPACDNDEKFIAEIHRTVDMDRDGNITNSYPKADSVLIVQCGVCGEPVSGQYFDEHPERA